MTHFAEVFDSLQGEGAYIGTRMRFIRFAGCNVGKMLPLTSIADPQVREARQQYPAHTVCTSVHGDPFLCDTDYHAVRTLEPPDLFTDSVDIPSFARSLKGPVPDTFCFTGGEPVINADFIFAVHKVDEARRLHIETSGTLPITARMRAVLDWITISPKLGFLPQNALFADEFKFVVGQKYRSASQTYELIARLTENLRVPIYVSPINGVDTIDREQTDWVIRELLPLDPRLRLNVQLHKILGLI